MNSLFKTYSFDYYKKACPSFPLGGLFFSLEEISLFLALHGSKLQASIQKEMRSFWVHDQGNEYNPLLHNPGFQQQSSTLNGPTALSSAFPTCSALNSAILGLSGTEGSSSQVFNTEAPHTPSLL
ncbi:hypothetical protein CR513_61336, partial [Mucuna pruriens]